MAKGKIQVSVTVIRQTPAALLVADENGTEGWVPRSQVEAFEIGTLAGSQCELHMPTWLADSRGFTGAAVSS